MPTIGLIAHMDTAPDAPGANIRAKIVPYDGKDILLNEERQIYLREADYPILNRSRGKHLIVTDGTTLLGADDKAGIAEILTVAEPGLPGNGAVNITVGVHMSIPDSHLEHFLHQGLPQALLLLGGRAGLGIFVGLGIK